MMQRTTVAGKSEPLTKPRLHAKIMRGWARCIDRMGKGAFADSIECSGPGLDKQLAGSMPGLEMLDRALCVDPSVLDDWLAHHGKRVVDVDAVCDADDMSLLMTRLLLLIQEAEHPDSPGGRAILHTELLPMEQLIRDVHGVTGNLIARINDLRRTPEDA